MKSPSPVTAISHRRLRPALGTWVAIEASADSSSGVAVAVEAAFEAVTAVQLQMHPHRDTSDVARLNRCQVGEAVVIEPGTWELLALAQRIHRLSAGVFDPCLPSHPGTMSDIELTPERTVVCRAAMALDLGGIAKGYAVDCAIDALLAHGCRSGLVNAGGDLRVFGARSTTILLREPDGHSRPVELSDAALAASDVDWNRKPAEHRGYYLRGAPAAPFIQRHAAVLAGSAAIADALVKCALLCPPDAMRELLREFGARQP